MITGEPLPTTATPNSQVSIPEHWPTTPKIITRSNPLLHIHTQLKTGLYHINGISKEVRSCKYGAKIWWPSKHWLGTTLGIHIPLPLHKLESIHTMTPVRKLTFKFYTDTYKRILFVFGLCALSNRLLDTAIPWPLLAKWDLLFSPICHLRVHYSHQPSLQQTI